MVAGLLSFAAACGSNDNVTGDCAVTHEQKTITTTEPAADPGLQFKIDSCRVDADACPSLCALAMTRAGISFNNGGVFNGMGGGDLANPSVPVAPGGGGFTGAPVNPAINCDVTFEDGNVNMIVKYDVFATSLGCPVQVDNTTVGTPGIATPSGGPK